MAGDRYKVVPKGAWAYLGAAVQAIDADLTALEAAGGVSRTGHR